MHTYDTLTAAVNDLDKRGYINDFDLDEEGVECKALGLHLKVTDFQIDEFYRFEGMNDPSDSSVLYAISSIDGEYKGVLIDAYGAYADNIDPAVLEKLKMQHRTGK